MLVAMMFSERIWVLLLYFLSAALHEMGHLIAARSLDLDVKEIRFDFSGVRILIPQGTISYRSELILAAAGPLANIIGITVCIVCFLVSGVSGSCVVYAMEDLIMGEMDLVGAAGAFVMFSFLQCLLNMLPVNTLDGGRVLFCSLAIFFGERVARGAIRFFSYFIAFTLIIIAFYLLLKISSGLGIFVFSACIFLSTVNCQEEK